MAWPSENDVFMEVAKKQIRRIVHLKDCLNKLDSICMVLGYRIGKKNEYALQCWGSESLSLVYTYQEPYHRVYASISLHPHK